MFKLNLHTDKIIFTLNCAYLIHAGELVFLPEFEYVVGTLQTFFRELCVLWPTQHFPS